MMNSILSWFGVVADNDADREAARAAFRDGVQTITPTFSATIICAMVTAVAMIAAGLSPFYVLLINMIVYAASAQLTVLLMLMTQAPVFVIWLAAAAVNLRFVIFSAGFRPYFRHLPLRQRLLYGFLNGDINSMLFNYRYRDSVPAPASFEQRGFFLGLALPNYCAWLLGCVIGTVFASFIPVAWGLQLAGVLTLLVLILKSVDHWAGVAACVMAALTAVLLHGLPNKLWIAVAILVAVVVAVAVESIWPNAWLSASSRRLQALKKEVSS